MSFTEKAKDVAHDVADKTKDVAHDVAEKTGDIVDKVGEKIPDSVKETAGDLKEKAEELIDKMKDRLGLGGDDTQETEAPTRATARRPTRRSPPIWAGSVSGRDSSRKPQRFPPRSRISRSQGSPSRWRGCRRRRRRSGVPPSAARRVSR